MPKVNYQINPSCKDCPLYKGAHKKAICLKGKNSDTHKPLVIFTDHPDHYANHAQRPYAMDSGRLLDWMLKRMSIDPAKVAYEYTLRCYPKGSLPTTKAGRAACIMECNKYRFARIAKIKPKAIVTLGLASLEAFTGKTKLKTSTERNWRAWEPVVARHCPTVWTSYSLAYCLMSPTDSTQVARTIWCAAEEAGLNPKVDASVPPFAFPTRMS